MSAPSANSPALGLVGNLWWPAIQYADVTAGVFKAFAEPGLAKTADRAQGHGTRG